MSIKSFIPIPIFSYAPINQCHRDHKIIASMLKILFVCRIFSLNLTYLNAIPIWNYEKAYCSFYGNFLDFMPYTT
jgi:hypothetical protein